MRLFCVSRYSSGVGRWKPGDEINVDDEVGEFLLRDSPGAFALEPPKAPKGKRKAAEFAFDVDGASIGELQAFAQEHGIELDAGMSEEDQRAAVQLALEEQAKAKLETEAAAGTTTTTRPQRRGNRR